MRPGVRLGIDFGSVRVGVARSDPHAILATPLATVPGDSDVVAAVVALIEEEAAFEVIVGDPVSLSGTPRAAAAAAREFAAALQQAWPQGQVRLVDERLTTVTSSAQLREAGRNTRKSRNVIDQASAVTILQNALDTEKRTGRPPGTPVTRIERPQEARMSDAGDIRRDQ
ncbi:MAG: Holliday junction resolvase RuvX [Actinobacteria bacterium]|nr:Holliday junction resolvase RuvX [Actinomycetota bacterium]